LEQFKIFPRENFRQQESALRAAARTAFIPRLVDPGNEHRRAIVSARCALLAALAATPRSEHRD
jgi:hypothetical protein